MERGIKRTELIRLLPPLSTTSGRKIGGNRYAISDNESNYRTEFVDTLKEAKRAFEGNNNTERWIHKYICPDCGEELKYAPTDFSDYSCKNLHNFTQFGEKSHK